jgi:hypothetical protein
VVPRIVSPTEWDAARQELLVKEKAATRARDALAAQRRRLPMVRIDKDYVFQGPDGQANLLDLFEGRPQLIIYHFMFAPSVDGWPAAGCPGCSFFVDQIGHLAHLHARNTSFALVSLAPLGTSSVIRSAWAGACHGSPPPIATSMSTSVSRPTQARRSASASSCARAIGSFAPISLPDAASRRWAAPGHSWI